MSDRLDLREAQRKHREWSLKNFGEHEAWQPLLGVVEEVGELSHAHLKASQGIRTVEDRAANKRDAVADIIIYLLDYCSCEGIDMEAELAATLERVWARDWKANPASAHLASETGKMSERQRNEAKIRQHLADGHPNPEGYLEWLATQSDEEVERIAHGEPASRLKT